MLNVVRQNNANSAYGASIGLIMQAQTFYSPLDFARFGNAGDRLYITHTAYCVRLRSIVLFRSS